MNISRRTISVFAMLVFAFTCLMQTSCSKEDMGDMVAKAKNKATEFKDKSGDAFNKAKDGAKKAASKIKESASGLSEKAATIKDSASKAVKSATGNAAKMVNKAGDMMSMNGSAKMSLDTPTEFPACYLRIVTLATGQTVLQMKSYSDDGVSESFPSYFIQGVTPIADISALSGKTVSCQLFAQKTADGDVWKNASGELVEIQFQDSQGKMTASFSGANLVNVANNTPSTSTGSFDCVNLD